MFPLLACIVGLNLRPLECEIPINGRISFDLLTVVVRVVYSQFISIGWNSPNKQSTKYLTAHSGYIICFGRSHSSLWKVYTLFLLVLHRNVFIIFTLVVFLPSVLSSMRCNLVLEIFHPHIFSTFICYGHDCHYETVSTTHKHTHTTTKQNKNNDSSWMEKRTDIYFVRETEPVCACARARELVCNGIYRLKTNKRIGSWSWGCISFENI